MCKYFLPEIDVENVSHSGEFKALVVREAAFQSL